MNGVLVNSTFSSAATSILSVLILGWRIAAAQAQVVNDESLGGAEQSVVTTQGTSDIITGGAIRGSGLFHSFTDFNVAEGRSLYFSPSDTITHIFSRVTGSNPSNIDGTLGVLSNADLFLLNPNGVFFGPNAQLDLSGSFTASTAVGLQFEGSEFSASQPQPVPLLSISAPFGINLGRNPGPIVSRSVSNGAGLTVQPSRSLSLIGGDITLNGGAITAVGGRIELKSQGDIALTNQSVVVVSNPLGQPDSEIHLVGQNITLEGQSGLFSANSSAVSGANIVLEAQNLVLMNGSQITTVTEGLGNGGKVLINVPGQVTLTNAARDRTIGDPSFISTTTLGGAKGGDIQINTGDLLTEYNGYISSDTGAFSLGDGGDITVQASRSVIGRYSSPTNGLGGGIQVGTRGAGTGGSLTVLTPRLNLTDHHILLSVSWLSGQGGDLRVEADEIQLSNNPQLSLTLASGIRAVLYGSGDGGDIEIATQSLSLQTGALINSQVELFRDDTLLSASALDPSLLALLGLPGPGTGNAGNIDVVAGTIIVDGFHLLAPTVPSQISSITQGAGNAGDVYLTSRELKLLNGGGTGSSSLFAFSNQGLPLDSGRGDGGNLTVNAEDITVSGSNPFTELSSLIGTQAGALGDAGDTTINTRRLRVLDGGLINSGTLTSGNGGALTIQAKELITVDGVNANGQISTIGTFALRPSEPLRQAFSLPEIPRGATQALQLSSDRLVVTNGGQISAEHQGIGNASNIRIQANQLLLDEGRIIAETGSGLGGDLTLNIQNELQLRDQSQITATARGGGNSGNVTISADTLLAIPTEDSDIVANSQGGRGGNITLRVNGLFGIQFREQLTNRSDITASSRLSGLDGTVNIDLLEPSPVSGLAQLPSQLLSASDQVSASCRQTTGSHFIISGRGGLPTNPRRNLIGIQPLLDERRGPADEAQGIELNSATPHLKSAPLQMASPSMPRGEATGWYLNSRNHVELVSGKTFSTNFERQQDCSSL